MTRARVPTSDRYGISRRLLLVVQLSNSHRHHVSSSCCDQLLWYISHACGMRYWRTCDYESSMRRYYWLNVLLTLIAVDCIECDVYWHAGDSEGGRGVLPRHHSVGCKCSSKWNSSLCSSHMSGLEAWTRLFEAPH